MGCFSLLSILQGFVAIKTESAANHRAQLSLMLVLTGAAYQIAIAGKLPPISYLTLLDTYTISTAAIIILVALQSRAFSYIHYDGDVSTPSDEYINADRVCTAVLAVLWVFANLSFAIKVFRRVREPRSRDEFLHHADKVILYDRNDDLNRIVPLKGGVSDTPPDLAVQPSVGVERPLSWYTSIGRPEKPQVLIRRVSTSSGKLGRTLKHATRSKKKLTSSSDPDVEQEGPAPATAPQAVQSATPMSPQEASAPAVEAVDVQIVKLASGGL